MCVYVYMHMYVCVCVRMYTYSVGPYQQMPSMVERLLSRQQHAEMVVYQISPSTACPATYPFLGTDGDCVCDCC